MIGRALMIVFPGGIWLKPKRRCAREAGQIGDSRSAGDPETAIFARMIGEFAPGLIGESGLPSCLPLQLPSAPTLASMTVLPGNLRRIAGTGSVDCTCRSQRPASDMQCEKE